MAAFFGGVGNLEAMAISEFRPSGQPCALCALLIPATGSPSGRGPNGRLHGQRRQQKAGWAGGQDGWDGGTRACAGRALSAGGSFGESPTSYPPCGLPRPPPPMPASAVRALPGTEVVMQPRPDHLRLTHLRLTHSPHHHQLVELTSFISLNPSRPLPPSLFSCDILDSVTPPTLRFTKPFFAHLANEKNT